MELIGETGTELDFGVLNAVVNIVKTQTPGDVTVEQADELLKSFMNREDLINFFIPALESDIANYAKYFVVKGMKNTISKLWTIIDPAIKEQVKTFIFSLIPVLLQQGADQYLILECNRVMVDILVIEWPEQWPSFLPDLFESTKVHPSVCTNSFDILTLLCEAIEEGEKCYIAIARTLEISDAIKENVESIMAFIQEVLKAPSDVKQANVAIKFLTCFVKFIEPHALFESGILNSICQQFMSEKELCVTVINLLAHAIAHPNAGPDINQYIPDVFDTVVTSLFEIAGADFSQAPELLENEAFQESFVGSITSFLVQNTGLISSPPHEEYYHQILTWLFTFTSTQSEAVFNTIVEFWRNFLRRAFMDNRSSQTEIPQFYIDLFAGLRRVLIEKMPNPIIERKIIDQDEREHIITSNNSTFGSLFSIARECIVFLTNFGEEDMIAAINEAYQKLQENELNQNQLASLCWATGAVAGALQPEVEAEFFPLVIQNLFAYNNSMENFEDKVVVAKGIAFISAHFYKFLQQPDHFVVLKAVIEKNVEFVMEQDQSLQAFAIDSLKALAHRCKPNIVTAFQENEKSILAEILESIDEIVAAIMLDNLPDFFELLAILIQGCTDSSEGITPQWLWENIINRIESCGEDEGDGEVYEQQIALFRSLTKIPLYLRQTNFPQLPTFINAICELYIELTSKLAPFCTEDEEVQPIGLLILGVKSEILIFLDRMLYFGNNVEICKNIIIPIAFGPFAEDYESVPPIAKSPNVLMLIGNIIKRISPEKGDFLQVVIEKIIQPTAEMFGDNFESFSDFRLYFFRLVGSITQRNNLITEVGEETADTILHLLFFGCKHSNQAISDASIYGLSDMIRLTGVAAHTEEQALSFLDRNMIEIVAFAFEMITDITYKFSFGLHVNTLRDLLSMDFVKERADAVYLRITEMYPNRPPEEIMNMLKDLMDPTSDIQKCKSILRNFLSVVSRISETDPDLYKAERDKNANDIIQYFKESVPGFISPSNLPLEDKPMLELVKNMATITI